MYAGVYDAMCSQQHIHNTCTYSLSSFKNQNLEKVTPSGILVYGPADFKKSSYTGIVGIEILSLSHSV